jgi:hypothetical protein
MLRTATASMLMGHSFRRATSVLVKPEFDHCGAKSTEMPPIAKAFYEQKEGCLALDDCTPLHDVWRWSSLIGTYLAPVSLAPCAKATSRLKPIP